jgi:hypothetical protein
MADRTPIGEHWPERLTVQGCEQGGPPDARVDAYYCTGLCQHDAVKVEYVRADLYRGAVKVPEGEGDPGFDAVVDALIGAFHFPEDHACRVAVVVLETLRGQ